MAVRFNTSRWIVKISLGARLELSDKSCSAGVPACECGGRPARCLVWRRDAARTRSRDGCATMPDRRFCSQPLVAVTLTRAIGAIHCNYDHQEVGDRTIGHSVAGVIPADISVILFAFLW